MDVRVRVHEGHFHQVKRMLAHVGGTVKALHRDAFGSLADPALPVGAVRSLTPAEVRELPDMLPVLRVATREMTDRHAEPAERARDVDEPAVGVSQQLLGAAPRMGGATAADAAEGRGVAEEIVDDDVDDSQPPSTKVMRLGARDDTG
eukprot:2927221-Prymnesium_polylepis.1